MSETTTMAEPSLETPAPHPTPHRRRPIPVRRRRRFLASLRFNALRYLTLAVTLGGAWGLVRVAMWRGTGTPESTFALVLAGGLLAAAAKTGIDVSNWAEENRQLVHAERVRAVQRVFRNACSLREQALLDWRRIHTVLVDNLSGQTQELRLFHDHYETDRQGEGLQQKALSEELWIRPEGVDAVRQFKRGIAALDYDALATEADFLGSFDALMDRLRRDLALAAIGIPLE